jgi:hypothetical protein
MSFDPSCIDVDDFLDCLDIENVTQATTTELRFSCPFPAHALGDETPSAYMNVETTAFFCHACHAKGNSEFRRSKRSACSGSAIRRAALIPTLAA